VGIGLCAVVGGLGGGGCGDPPATLDAAAPPDAANVRDAAVDAAVDANLLPLPDLTVNVGRARADLAIQIKDFDVDACELDPVEDCIDAAGQRTLLHFSVETPNVGNEDMVLGSPSQNNPQFAYSSCHDHFHFLGYAEYDLLDAGGRPVASGQKQAFCLLDSERYVSDDPSVAMDAQYWCGFQGIQRGWSDVYHSRLPCQFIDVTDTPAGDYTLQVRINNGGTLPELSFDNNLVQVPITIGDPSLVTPTEPCPAELDAHSTSRTNRECGWTFAGTFACDPGEELRVGCSQACGDVGSCTGDPMLRVCDAARADGNCSFPGAIASDDDSCGSQCPFVFDETCPPSGMISVFHAALVLGTPYTCSVEVD
jgi:hypothetical protein